MELAEVKRVSERRKIGDWRWQWSTCCGEWEGCAELQSLRERDRKPVRRREAERSVQRARRGAGINKTNTTFPPLKSVSAQRGCCVCSLIPEIPSTRDCVGVCVWIYYPTVYLHSLQSNNSSYLSWVKLCLSPMIQQWRRPQPKQG